jgi:hypothetical protein
MNQNQLKNLVDEIYGHAFSLREDVGYGLEQGQEIRLTTEEQTELNQISDKLMSISEKVGMQFIIQDFE